MQRSNVLMVAALQALGKIEFSHIRDTRTQSELDRELFTGAGIEVHELTLAEEPQATDPRNCRGRNFV